MEHIPFSPPRIDEKTIAAVTEVLRSGWITTGPKTRELEQRIASYVGVEKVLCLNSWTNAAELVLRWFGVGPGDEVIVPVYTYAATANIVLHLGATPVPVDTAPDSFLADLDAVERAISPRTKVIMPVDVGGLPVDYQRVMECVRRHSSLFEAANERQRMLGRILVLGDAAHSFGAKHLGKPVGAQVDIMGYSFHAVKNFTTAEGGALTLHLPAPFDNAQIWKELNVSALHGQTKDALSKSQAGEWRYDIVEAGYKCNLTDIHAAIGLVEMDRYESETIPRRKHLCERYNDAFAPFDWAIRPAFRAGNAESSYHLYQLRIRGCSEAQRDEIIRIAAHAHVSLNVHFQPLPLLSVYRNLGWSPEAFPAAMAMYSNEVSLPVYYDLSDAQADRVVEVVRDAYQKVCA